MTHISIYALADISIFTEFINLFKKDEYLIIDNENEIIYEDTIMNGNEVAYYNELIKMSNSFVCLEFLSEYMNRIIMNESKNSTKYTISCTLDEDDFNIRVFQFSKHFDENVEEYIDDSDGLYKDNDTTYYYKDRVITFSHNELLVKIYGLDIEIFKELLVK